MKLKFSCLQASHSVLCSSPFTCHFLSVPSLNWCILLSHHAQLTVSSKYPTFSKEQNEITWKKIRFSELMDQQCIWIFPTWHWDNITWMTQKPLMGQTKTENTKSMCSCNSSERERPKFLFFCYFFVTFYRFFRMFEVTKIFPVCEFVLPQLEDT